MRCTTHTIVILSISGQPVYLSPVLFSPYPGKNEFWKKTLEKLLLSNTVNHHEGTGLYFPPTFMHHALHIAVLCEYLLRRNLGKDTEVFISLILLSGLNLKFLFHGASCSCSVSFISAFINGQSHYTGTNWRSQALESMYHH